MTELSDPFRYDDAAYVLGGLDESDRAAFEAHLETCADCRARVAEARAGHQLLAGLALDDIEDVGAPPDTVLPGLLRAAKRQRERRRWLTTSLAAVAAACAVALTVVLWPAGSGSPSGPVARAFTAVRPSPVDATGKLVAKKWGTEIDLRCRYSDGHIERYVPYKLVVVDDQGQKHDAGSWTLVPDKEITFTGGTAVRIPDIAKVQITLETGQPILQLTT
jgi:Putative zinc-finger